MTIRDIMEVLGLRALNAGALTRKVVGAYCSDMLSDVMAHARDKQIWITVQVHQNVAAVATLVDLSAIVITGGKKPSEELLSKAESHDIPVLSTDMTSYELAGRLYALLKGDS